MSEAPMSFFALSILALAAVVAVFAMKYAATAYRSQLEARRRDGTDAALDALRQEVGALTGRVNAIEKILREVE